MKQPITNLRLSLRWLQSRAALTQSIASVAANSQPLADLIEGMDKPRRRIGRIVRPAKVAVAA